MEVRGYGLGEKSCGQSLRKARNLAQLYKEKHTESHEWFADFQQ